MSKPVTLIHLSDLHLRSNPGKHPAEGFTTLPPYQVVEHLVSRIGKDFPRAHVVITGDVVDRGSKAGFDAAAEVLCPLIGGAKLSVVPGNHDDSFTRFFVRERGIESMYAAFEAAASNAHSVDGGMPYVKYVRHVAIIGLNSAHDTRRPSATGSIGEEQLGRLDRLLDKTAVRNRVAVILLHHHPYSLPRSSGIKEFFMELNDAEALRGVLADRVDLVLFGHKHRSHLRRRFSGVPLWASAPSSVGPDRNGCYRFRVFEIFDDGRIDHRWVKFDESAIGMTVPEVGQVECPVTKKGFDVDLAVADLADPLECPRCKQPVLVLVGPSGYFRAFHEADYRIAGDELVFRCHGGIVEVPDETCSIHDPYWCRHHSEEAVLVLADRKSELRVFHELTIYEPDDA